MQEIIGNEVRITQYTPEQAEVFNYTKGIISGSSLPEVRLDIYRTIWRFFRVDYYDGEEKTIFLEAVDRQWAEHLIRNGAHAIMDVRGIAEVAKDEIPENVAIESANTVILSTKMHVAPDDPNWFAVVFVWDEAGRLEGLRLMIESTPEEVRAVLGDICGKYRMSWIGERCLIDAEETNHESLMKLLQDVRPLLNEKYRSLYSCRNTTL